jgi:hypothetical protein
LRRGGFVDISSGAEASSEIRAQIDGIERGAFLKALATETAKSALTAGVVRNAVLDDADVVVISDAASHHDFETLGPANGVLVDCAAGFAALSALALCGCQKIVIAGDFGGPETLLMRWERLGVKVKKLETQFRQHPLLTAFASQHFYKNAILSGPQHRPPVPVDGLVWPRSAVPVAFVEIAGRRAGAEDSAVESRKRPADDMDDAAAVDAGDVDDDLLEASKVVELLAGAVEARRGVNGTTSIAVVAATSTQLAKILKLWRRRADGPRDGDDARRPCDDVVEFGLVDDFRGWLLA